MQPIIIIITPASVLTVAVLLALVLIVRTVLARRLPAGHGLRELK